MSIWAAKIGLLTIFQLQPAVNGMQRESGTFRSITTESARSPVVGKPFCSSKPKDTDVVFETNLVDGAEAERLGLHQAAVIRDVLLWHHRNGNSASPHTGAT
ncbi:hypothetical protein GCM10022243_39710 [Saccharothrix violaceirubra]